MASHLTKKLFLRDSSWCISRNEKQREKNGFLGSIILASIEKDRWYNYLQIQSKICNFMMLIRRHNEALHNVKPLVSLYQHIICCRPFSSITIHFFHSGHIMGIWYSRLENDQNVHTPKGIVVSRISHLAIKSCNIRLPQPTYKDADVTIIK